MTRRFRVRVVRTTSFLVEVDAKNMFEASSRAETLVSASEVMPDDEHLTSDNWIQVGEPWVSGNGWETGDPALDTTDQPQRPDRYMGTKGLLVFRRALGNVFSKEECDLLRARVKTIVGIDIDSCWNGPGCESFSIWTVDEFPLLSLEQVAALLAPKAA